MKTINFWKESFNHSKEYFKIYFFFIRKYPYWSEIKRSTYYFFHPIQNWKRMSNLNKEIKRDKEIRENIMKSYKG